MYFFKNYSVYPSTLPFLFFFLKMCLRNTPWAHYVLSHTHSSPWLMGGNSFLFDTYALLPMSGCNPMSGTFISPLLSGLWKTGWRCALQSLIPKPVHWNYTLNLNVGFSSLKGPFGLLSVALRYRIIARMKKNVSFSLRAYVHILCGMQKRHCCLALKGPLRSVNVTFPSP